jgi:hypothetical protein
VPLSVRFRISALVPRPSTRALLMPFGRPFGEATAHRSYSAWRRSLILTFMHCRREGVRGFYKGLGSNILRVLPATCVTFVVYESLAAWLPTTP